MTLRSSNRWHTFERDRILGRLSLSKPKSAPGEDEDGVNPMLKDGRGSTKVAVVRDVDQESLNETTGSRPEVDDRQKRHPSRARWSIVGRNSEAYCAERSVTPPVPVGQS